MRPMLASKADLNKLQYPVLASAKLDGIRCIVDNGEPRSRSWKVIPNKAFQQAVFNARQLLQGVDGEVVVGKPTHPNVYQTTMSGLMSEWTSPTFMYLVFDLAEASTSTLPYRDRYALLRKRTEQLGWPDWCQVLLQLPCANAEDLFEAEEMYVQEGYEGMIVRSPLSPYKYGRSTVREGHLLKLKRYDDAEAEIIDFEELRHNDNPAYLDDQGYTRHTSHRLNQRPGGMLGALKVRLVSDPSVTFSIGTGFDIAQREWFWTNRHTLKGKIIKFKHLPHGQLNAPRHPVFLGFRHEHDT